MERKELIELTMRNLKRNNMDAVYVANKEELKQTLKRYFKEGDMVTFGGSMTLKETGVYHYLKELGEAGTIDFLDRDVEGADVQSIFRSAFSSDVYVTSTNALTKNGWLFNVDGNGNRVAAMIFGPKSVVVIAGYNKIVETKEEAEERVRKIAAPKNAQRLHLDTPCAKTCLLYTSPVAVIVHCNHHALASQRAPFL